MTSPTFSSIEWPSATEKKLKFKLKYIGILKMLISNNKCYRKQNQTAISNGFDAFGLKVFKFIWVYDYSILSAKHVHICNYITMSVYVVFGIGFLHLIWQQMDQKYRKTYVINTYLLSLIIWFISEFIYCSVVTYY